ncbi:Hypothetical predicted protein, partial [Mytilus galloprovincialis]
QSVLISASTTLFIDPLTWNDANKYCKSIGQNLVAIARQAKEIYLQKAILDINSNINEIWIGLHVPDSKQPTDRVWTNNCFPPYWFENWSPSLNIGNGDLCAYVEVESGSMYWFLAECGTDTKPFICESSTAICEFETGISYDIESDKRVPTGMSGTMQKNPGTEQECKEHCNGKPICWGFLFNPTVPKCVMYDLYDDPFRTDNDQIDASGEDLYMKRCDFDLNEDTNDLIVPPYDGCGSAVISDCVLCVSTTEESTTEYQTSVKETTSVKVSTADKATVTAIQSTTTEHNMTSTVEIATSDLHSTTIKSETIPIAETTIDLTTQKEFTTVTAGKTPYCVCTCNNVSKQMSLEERINEIVKEIKVDKSKTSSFTRKHSSAWDSRKSSASIGYVGIAIMISIASLLLCLDSSSLISKVFAKLKKSSTRK